MKSLTWYYVSRAVFAMIGAAITWSVTQSIWLALVAGLVMMAGFAWYARSGHFVVDASRPLTPLRRDEREQVITYRAATYAFVGVMLALAAFIVLDVPTQWLSLVLLAGFVVYFLARAWLRRVQ